MKSSGLQVIKDARRAVRNQFAEVRKAAGIPEPMQRLVVQYHVSDGCTYSVECTAPVLYESGEALLVALEEAAMKWKTLAWDARSHVGAGNFLGMRLDDFFEDGKYYAPTVSTLYEWFEENVSHEFTAGELAAAGQPWLRTYDGKFT